MKLLQNIPGFIKLYSLLGGLNQYKKEIEDAREKGVHS